MPTIELVAINCAKAPVLPSFSTFGTIVEPQVTSHRALFKSIFSQTSGIIVHLGNKDLEEERRQGNDGFWFAGELIDWGKNEIILPAVELGSDDEQWWGEDQAELFHFRSAVITELKQLIKLLFAHAPAGRIYFSTDYQFGPAVGSIGPTCSTRQFFAEHDRLGLRWNCLYTLTTS